VNGNGLQRDRLILPVAAVVLAAWSASLAAGIITQAYTALTVTTPVMLVLAGYVFGVGIVRSRENGNGNGNGNGGGRG
jgi:hypothetical protein